MKTIKMISSILLVIGGLNWGLVGILNLDLVQLLVGRFEMFPTIVYGLIGLSGVYHVVQGNLLDS